jgi:hypothetical protein
VTYTPPPYHFGTLRTVNDDFTDKADDEAAGGNRIGHYEIFLDRARPTSSGYSTGYGAQIASDTALIRSAGLKLSIGFGLHYPPAWMFTAITNSRLVNQNGGTSSVLNYVYNTDVWAEAEAYLGWINSQVGFGNVWNIHLTSAVDAELLYPGSGGTPAGGWWGYDANAQGTASRRPDTIAACPYPGWIPGATTITVAQAEEWYHWYLDSLIDVIDRQIRLLRDAYGYTGWLTVMTPGSGTRPSGYATEAAARFGTASGTTQVGAVWHHAYPKLVDRHGVIAYCSSAADNSGSPANNVTTAGDAAVAVTSSTADTYAAQRWIARLALAAGTPYGQENAGYPFYTHAATAATVMDNLLAQAAAATALNTMWAHSKQLWDGTSTFATWQTKIAARNTGGPGTPPNPP